MIRQPQRRAVLRAREKAKQQSQAEPGEIYLIGKNAFPQIRDRQHDNQRGEDRPFQSFGIQSKNEITGQEEKPCSQFHHRVHRGDPHLAFAATPGEHEPAHHGDVVIRLDQRSAGRAMRRRQHHRFRVRDAQNANVQKTADDQAEEKYGERDHASW